MASAVSNLRAGSNEKNNTRFNEEALSWDARPFVHEASQAAAKAILAKCEALDFRPKQCLEIGCGTGILSYLLAPHLDRIVAVDAAEGMIEVLKTKLQKPDAPKNIAPVAVLLEDPEDKALPPTNESNPKGGKQKFDLITSHLVLHHIPDLQGVLQTMLGCLRVGGKVMLTDFEDFGPEAKRFHPASKMGGVERHGIDASEMAALMEKAGFVNVGVTAEWTMTKKVEKYDGEFDEDGMVRSDMGQGIVSPEKGEMMDFPFVICCGERPS